VIDAIVDLLFPPDCALCGTEIELGSLVLCPTCEPAPLERLANSCDMCGAELPYLEGKNVCVPCALFPLPADRVRSIWKYEGNAEHLVKSLKYAGSRRLLRYFSRELFAAMFGERPLFPVRRWNLVLGLPSDLKILRKRGYSHTGVMAARLATELRIKNSPLALLPRGKRVSQASLTIEKRAFNVRGKFVADKRIVNGMKILLLDDVLTTGSSVSEAAKTLKRAGAAVVDVVTLSRSTHYQQNRLRLFS
jgi:ComF family protein